MLEAMRDETRTGFATISDRLGNIERRIGSVETEIGEMKIRLGTIESRLDAMDLRVSDEGTGGDRLANRLNRVEVLTRAAFEAGQEAAAEVDRLARRLSKLERGED